MNYANFNLHVHVPLAFGRDRGREGGIEEGREEKRWREGGFNIRLY